MFVHLTNHAGMIDELPKLKHKEEKKTGDCEEKKTGDCENGDEESASGEELRVVSMGRQRFGDTRNMPFYPLEHPTLVAFMQ